MLFCVFLLTNGLYSSLKIYIHVQTINFWLPNIKYSNEALNFVHYKGNVFLMDMDASVWTFCDWIYVLDFVAWRLQELIETRMLADMHDPWQT